MQDGVPVRRELNKKIFSARIGPLADDDPTREWQQIDLFGSGPTTAVDIGDGTAPVTFLSEGLLSVAGGHRRSRYRRGVVRVAATQRH